MTLQVDLTGGYYDAGDNVKFGWPMSFTVSLLSWAASQYRSELSQAKQLDYLLRAIRWGADFIMKAHRTSTTLWTQEWISLERKIVSCVYSALGVVGLYVLSFSRSNQGWP